MNAGPTQKVEQKENNQPTDSEIVRFIATSPHPVATTEIANHFDLPRSTTWDRLNPLEEDGQVESWNPTDQSRMWSVPGQFGDVSLTNIYGTDPLTKFLETGQFPSDTEWDQATYMIEEALLELNWNIAPTEGVKYDEFKRLAELFDLSVAEFAELSPKEVCDRMDNWGVDDVPGAAPNTDVSADSPASPGALIEADVDPQDEVRLSDGNVVSLESYPDFRNIRSRNGIPQDDIADSSGVSQTVISQWENNRRSLTPNELVRLWSALDTYLDDSDS